MRESRGVELLVKVDAAESFIQVNCDPPLSPPIGREYQDTRTGTVTLPGTIRTTSV